MSISEQFPALFEIFTDHSPFPWQRKLFDMLRSNEFPDACDIPTGLGKTSTIPIWLLALADHVMNGTMGHFPRRLVYVVNRRTVVDQATRVKEEK